MFTQNKKSKFIMYHAFSETHFGRYCMNINQFKNQKINNDYISLEFNQTSTIVSIINQQYLYKKETTCQQENIHS